MRVFAISFALILTILSVEKSKAAQNLSIMYCNTTAEYKKMMNHVRSYSDTSDQLVDHVRKQLGNKYKGLSLVQRETNKDYKRDFKKAMRSFKPKKPDLTKFACEKIPGRKVVIEKAGMFSGYACVRPVSQRNCKWLSRAALNSRWSIGSDGKTWSRKY